MAQKMLIYRQRHFGLIMDKLLGFLKGQKAKLSGDTWLSQNTFHALFAAQDTGAIVTDSEGNVRNMNVAAESLTGWNIVEATGRPLSDVANLSSAPDGKPWINPIAKSRSLLKSVPISPHTQLICRNGSTVNIQGSVSPVTAPNSIASGLVMLVEHASPIHRIAEKLACEASHDAMTGLINRREFDVRLRKLVDSANMRNAKHALCFMDLDRFRTINDSCGHAAGDELMRRVAVLIKSEAGAGDNLARLGSDEFALLLEDCPLDKAETICKRIVDAVASYRFVWQGKTHGIGVSIGLVAVTAPASDMHKLIGMADNACHAAKDKGRGRLQVHRLSDPDLIDTEKQSNLVQQIATAVDENRFALYYQPIATLAGYATEAHYYEVLLRMNFGDKIMPPGFFLPVARRFGMMDQLDRWVISRAFATYHRIQQHKTSGPSHDIWSINLSSSTLLKEGFVEFVRNQATQYNISPQSICFEINEGDAIADLDQVTQVMWALKTEGFRLALDNFGMGMSNFTHLRGLPVDTLKIDGSFVKDMLYDRVNESIVESVQRIAQSMSMKTVAEFVEDGETLEKLANMGINYAQGYIAGKPMRIGGHHDPRDLTMLRTPFYRETA
jgi:diguanylate cyclase (GGDEF)-like protein/PAS domain S-box-containing protein